MQYLSVVLPAAVRRAGTQQPSLLLFFFFFLFYTETGNTHSTLCFSACHRGLLTTLTQLRPHGAQTDQNRLQKALRVMPSLEKHYYHRHIIKNTGEFQCASFPVSFHWVSTTCITYNSDVADGLSHHAVKGQVCKVAKANWQTQHKWISAYFPSFSESSVCLLASSEHLKTNGISRWDCILKTSIVFCLFFLFYSPFLFFLSIISLFLFENFGKVKYPKNGILPRLLLIIASRHSCGLSSSVGYMNSLKCVQTA